MTDLSREIDIPPGWLAPDPDVAGAPTASAEPSKDDCNRFRSGSEEAVGTIWTGVPRRLSRARCDQRLPILCCD